MNLRILKKLSKRAAPLLAHFQPNGELFLAARDENYIGSTVITERKHWDRMRSVHADCSGDREIKTPARDGRGWVYMCPPSTPLKGTPMVGGMSDYYEPEWEERTAWEELRECVTWQGRPDTMTDAEWSLTLRIARCKPITAEEMDAWAEECLEQPVWVGLDMAEAADA